MMNIKSVRDWLNDRCLDADQLLQRSGLDRKIVVAILEGRYTPSPQQRQRIAAALDVAVEEIDWHHVNPVVHVYGHGPQFGRSP